MTVLADTIPLMKQLAAMAGIPEGRIRRMVLVLDVNDIPRLFTEGFLTAERSEGVELEKVSLEVTDEPIVVNTTTMQNEFFVTKTPVERRY